jgi:pimeloyl-ACP methyl ester carboxylesterase
VLLLLLVLLGAAWAWTPDLPSAELQARWATPPSRFVEAGGLRWHLRDSGPAAAAAEEPPPVLMLHGFGSSLHTWEGWAAALAPQQRVLRVDLPGAGLTGPDPQRRYDDDHAVQQLLALLDALGLQRVALVGHSMGGRLAWRLAVQHPQRVARLVLVAPDGFESPGFEYGKPPDVGFGAGLLPYVLPRVALRAGLAPAWGDEARLTEAMVTRYHELLRAPGNRQAVLDRLAQLRLEDPRPLLATLQAPVLLVWGEADRMIPPRHAQDWLQALPAATAAQLLLLPGLGHVPQEEDASAGLQAITTFLRGD